MLLPLAPLFLLEVPKLAALLPLQVLRPEQPHCNHDNPEQGKRAHSRILRLPELDGIALRIVQPREIAVGIALRLGHDNFGLPKYVVSFLKGANTVMPASCRQGCCS